MSTPCRPSGSACGADMTCRFWSRARSIHSARMGSTGGARRSPNPAGARNSVTSRRSCGRHRSSRTASTSGKVFRTRRMSKWVRNSTGETASLARNRPWKLSATSSRRLTWRSSSCSRTSPKAANRDCASSARRPATELHASTVTTPPSSTSPRPSHRLLRASPGTPYPLSLLCWLIKNFLIHAGRSWRCCFFGRHAAT